MTTPDALYHNIKKEDHVVAQWFTKEHAEHYLERPISDDEWEELVDWFDSSEWADQVSTLFATFLRDATDTDNPSTSLR